MDTRYSLVFEGGNRNGEAIAIRSSKLRIGRKPGNDLVIEDANISGSHAEISFDGERVFLRDLGSTNGTLLDGRKIDEAPLSHNDKITIGHTFLRFLDAQAAVQAPSEPHHLKLGAASAKRSLLLPIVLIAALAGAGGFYFFASSSSSASAGAPVKEVAGNLIRGFSFEPSENETASTFWNFQDGGEESFAIVSSRRSGVAGAGASFATSGVASIARLAAAQPTPIEMGQRYRVAGWARIQGNAAAAAIGVRFSSASDTQVFVEERSAWHRGEAGAGMQRIEAEFDAPPGADRATIFALGAGSDGKVVWDDLELVKTGAAAPSAKFQEFAFRFSAQDGFVHKIDSYLLRSFRNEWRDRAGKSIMLTEQVQTSVVPNATGFVLRYSGTSESGSPLLRFLVTPACFGDNGAMTLRGTQSALYTADFQEDKVESLVLGGEANQMRLGLTPASLVRGRAVAEGFAIEVAWEKELSLHFQMSFEEEKRKASELLLEAQKGEEEKAWGRALVAYSAILNRFPFDKRSAEKARARYDALLREGQQRIVALEKSEEEARFFGLRDGYLQANVAAETLAKAYEGSEIAARAQAAAVRIASGLRELQILLDREEAARLKGLAAGLEAAKQKKLAEELRAYLRAHYVEGEKAPEGASRGENL